jgi:membrane fusion protein (multidrug efflux system)
MLDDDGVAGKSGGIEEAQRLPLKLIDLGLAEGDARAPAAGVAQPHPILPEKVVDGNPGAPDRTVSLRSGSSAPVATLAPSSADKPSGASAIELRAKPETNSPSAAVPTAPAPSRSLRRLAIPLSAVSIVAALAFAATARWETWLGAAAVQTTDDAIVRSDMTQLSARVSGNIRRVAVRDFQRVKAGDLLMEIDPADYEAVIAQAEANVSAARAVLDNLENQRAFQRAAISQAEAQRLSAVARAVQTRQEQRRQDTLLRGGLAGTAQQVEHGTADYDVARAAVTASEATIEAQRQQLNVLGGQQGLLSANVAAAEAALTTARLRLAYTRIVAPVDGVVGERQVQEGDYVNVGSNLITVVPLPEVYVTANYKETQLTHVAPGQPVEVKVDMFPEAVLQGRVARLSPASGATFALLPPDNATGNFTKVVQRIPIRIEFEPGQSLVERLRPGMSVVTRVHVDDAKQKLAQAEGGHGN